MKEPRNIKEPWCLIESSQVCWWKILHNVWTSLSGATNFSTNLMSQVMHWIFPKDRGSTIPVPKRDVVVVSGN
jgi:hypothetical protein